MIYKPAPKQPPQEAIELSNLAKVCTEASVSAFRSFYDAVADRFREHRRILGEKNAEIEKLKAEIAATKQLSDDLLKLMQQEKRDKESAQHMLNSTSNELTWYQDKELRSLRNRLGGLLNRMMFWKQ